MEILECQVSGLHVQGFKVWCVRWLNDSKSERLRRPRPDPDVSVHGKPRV